MVSYVIPCERLVVIVQYTSLYFSLTVIPIALQWIWAVPRSDARTAFCHLQMRKEALSKWWVPQMIQILPSLISFLVALWNPDNGRVSIFAQYFLDNFSLCFFTSTTFFPTFQEYLLYLPCLDVRRGEIMMPIPCPYYRSDQSRFFRQLFTYNKFTLVLLSPLSFPFSVVYYLWVLMPITYKFVLRILGHRPRHRHSQTFGRVRPDFHLTWTQKTWDLDFLQIRWRYFKNGYNTSPQKQKRVKTYVTGQHFNEDLLYDAVRGLQTATVSKTAQISVIYICCILLFSRTFGFGPFFMHWIIRTRHGGELHGP